MNPLPEAAIKYGSTAFSASAAQRRIADMRGGSGGVHTALPPGNNLNSGERLLAAGCRDTGQDSSGGSRAFCYNRWDKLQTRHNIQHQNVRSLSAL